jgi:hypothetical protein
MIDIRTLTPARASVRSLLRIPPSAFWALIATQGLVLIVAAVLLLPLAFPKRPALSSHHEIALVRDAIAARLAGSTGDPRIELSPGVVARSSQIRGLALDGTVYYYYHEQKAGFDPLSRGTVTRDDIEIVLREPTGEDTLVIYRLHAD